MLFLQEKATKWYSDGEIDGLTTNGILIMHPVGGFSPDSKPGVWREVSVGGGIYALRESRSTPQKSSLVSSSILLLHLDETTNLVIIKYYLLLLLFFICYYNFQYVSLFVS